MIWEKHGVTQQKLYGDFGWPNGIMVLWSHSQSSSWTETQTKIVPCYFGSIFVVNPSHSNGVMPQKVLHQSPKKKKTKQTKSSPLMHLAHLL